MLISVRREEPDMIIHLGDGWNEAQRLMGEYPGTPLEQVPGNCDFGGESTTKLIAVEGFSIMFCHGHTYNVKMSLLNLECAAQEKNADIVLFGHTHCVYYDKYNGITYLNPGSVGLPGFRSSPSYGLLYLDGEKGTIEADVRYL